MSIDASGNVIERKVEKQNVHFEVFFKNGASKPIDLYWNGGKWVWQGKSKKKLEFNSVHAPCEIFP